MSLPDGFHYQAGVFDAPTAAAHLSALLADVPWERHEIRLYGRAIPMPRLVAMYGPVPYRYSGVEHPACPLPARVAAIRDHVEGVTGRRFNAVLLNLYRDGRDGVSWHRDDDYEHGGRADIASVSFGASRRFQLTDRTGSAAEIVLEAGSVLLMSAAAVTRWWHRVPKTTASVGPRVNLTFRYMAGRADRTGG